MWNRNADSTKGMEIKTGQYIKLGRVWFKIKETSESAKDLSNFQILRSPSSDSSSENTDVLISENELGHHFENENCDQGSFINLNSIV